VEANGVPGRGGRSLPCPAAASKKTLAEDKKFKRSVLDEGGDKIDLKAMARRYMECLNEIHVEIREMTSKQLARARETFMRHISLGQAKYGSKHTVFEARCQDHEGGVTPAKELSVSRLSVVGNRRPTAA
jgi:hypothetical protein